MGSGYIKTDDERVVRDYCAVDCAEAAPGKLRTEGPARMETRSLLAGGGSSEFTRRATDIQRADELTTPTRLTQYAKTLPRIAYSHGQTLGEHRSTAHKTKRPRHQQRSRQQNTFAEAPAQVQITPSEIKKYTSPLSMIYGAN